LSLDMAPLFIRQSRTLEYEPTILGGTQLDEGDENS